MRLLITTDVCACITRFSKQEFSCLIFLCVLQSVCLPLWLCLYVCLFVHYVCLYDCVSVCATAFGAVCLRFVVFCIPVVLCLCLLLFNHLCLSLFASDCLMCSVCLVSSYWYGNIFHYSGEENSCV